LSLVPAVRRPILKADRSRTAVLGLIWLAFPLSMFPYAEQHVSSALAGMLNGAVPLFVAAGPAVWRAAAAGRLVGLAVGFLGTILIALPGLTASGSADGQAIGVLLILAALVSYGFAYSLSGPLQQRNGALPVIWRALGVAVVLTAPLGVPAVLAGRWSFWPVASLVALGAGGTGVAYVLTAVAAGRLGDRRVGEQLPHPVVALALGVGLRHEQVSRIPTPLPSASSGAWLIRRARPWISRARRNLLFLSALSVISRSARAARHAGIALATPDTVSSSAGHAGVGRRIEPRHAEQQRDDRPAGRRRRSGRPSSPLSVSPDARLACGCRA
jgi:drug/metabolite transporter (DMT)-like permease